MDNTETWWYEELKQIFIASRGSVITDDMKRAANVAMKVAEGKVYNENNGLWEKPDA